MILGYAIVNGAGAVINVVLGWFNSLTITIPVIDVDVPFPDLPLVPTVPFPPWAVIPFRIIDDVRIFQADRILILYILELLGISFPF